VLKAAGKAIHGDAQEPAGGTADRCRPEVQLIDVDKATRDLAVPPPVPRKRTTGATAGADADRSGTVGGRRRRRSVAD
jgi:hypothetical protein